MYIFLCNKSQKKRNRLYFFKFANKSQTYTSYTGCTKIKYGYQSKKYLEYAVYLRVNNKNTN